MQLATANSKCGQGQRKISPKTIKVRIAERETSVSEIARVLGYARNTVSLAIHHPTLFPAVRARVLDFLNLV